MVTKIKPRRIKSNNLGSLGDFLGYRDEATFQWEQGNGGDMAYADFEFQTVTATNNEITLELGTDFTPNANFIVNAPTTIKEGQTYILRVDNGATAYTMSLGNGISNPKNVDLTLNANAVDMFSFLAVGGALELQPEAGGTSDSRAFKPFLASFDTTHTTSDFLDSISALNLPVGNAYLGQVSLSDMPEGVAVQGDVEVYVYPQNVIYAIMRSAEVPPYEWVVDSYSNYYYNRGWTPVANMYTGSSAPTSSATEGMLWYDTTNDKLKIYDGTNWNETGVTYIAGTGIDITNNTISADTTVLATKTDLSKKQDKLIAGDNITISDNMEWDTKGPAPSGFHVPLKSECDILKGYMETLDSTNYITYYQTLLKFPLYNNQGYSNRGQYLCSDLFDYPNSDYGGAYVLSLRANTVGVTRIKDCSTRVIRAFKNVPVVPDSTWTTLFDGSSIATGAGIFHNTTDGLISISADGTNWITIQDKNLGATQVYEVGDTMVEANCGRVFQQGNNYAFPGAGNTEPVTTSSNKVDVTGYGPGNYYYSNVRIDAGLNQSWFIEPNFNIWGGTSQSTHKEGEVISAIDTTYTAGTNITIDSNNVISSTGASYTAGKNIDIDQNNVISAIDTLYYNGKGINISSQWDTINDFRIPTNDDWEEIKDMLVGLTPAQVRDFLKLPRCGRRDPDGNASGLTGGTYWSSTANTSDEYAYAFGMNSGEVYATYPVKKSVACPIRQIYNKKEGLWNNNNPYGARNTYGWEDIYEGTLIGDGTEFDSNELSILWNEHLGLISILSRKDGADFGKNIVIADKNLGASKVWNSGDILTEENVGKVFQRGNGYGFPGTYSNDEFNTSGTQIDTSNYDYNNMYFSDTYITGNNDWSLSTNDNLWGSNNIGLHSINAINNAGVSSLNGKVGDITIPEHFVQNYDPADIDVHQSVHEGDLWYNPSSDTLKVYNGSSWDDIDTNTTYTAGTGINIASNIISADTTVLATKTDLSEKQDKLIAGEGIEIVADIVNDMQGPCPAGFHVPTKTEWQSVKTIWRALGGGLFAGTDFMLALKLPKTGSRNPRGGNVMGQGSQGFFWSSTFGSRLDVSSSEMSIISEASSATGAAIRGFKDVAAIPDSTWTKMYGTSIEDGGIFWSATEGLISLSSDGTTWITIADKNLGATQVRENGDTLSETNCGGYFQWGNNYMFPFTGEITIDTHLVDTTGYGPGNYYSSSTYISAYYGNWLSVSNDNLRGGVSQSMHKEGDVISAIDTTYTAGTNITIDANNEISAAGDMAYEDFEFETATLDNGAIELSQLSTTYTPTANFTVNKPSTIKDGMQYLLRIENGATAYTMTLGTGITNPKSVDLTLTANSIDMFAFYAVNGVLELQPAIPSASGNVDYSDFEFETATSGATLTISDFSTEFTPNQNFSIVAGTVKEGMQYIVRINTGATIYTISLGTGITNPYSESLNLTANKTTTLVFLATSSSTLELATVMTDGQSGASSYVIPVLSYISYNTTNVNMTIFSSNSGTTTKYCNVETLNIQQAGTYKITLSSCKSDGLFVWVNDSPINIDYTTNTDNDEMTSQSTTVVVTVSTSDVLKVGRGSVSGSTQFFSIYVEKIDIQSGFISLASS